MIETTDIQRFTEQADYKRPTPRQRALVEHLVSTGEDVPAAAASLGMDRSNAYKMLRKQHVKYYMLEQIVKQSQINAVIATGRLSQLINHQSGMVSLEAAKTALKQAGVAGSDKKQVSVAGSISCDIDLS